MKDLLRSSGGYIVPILVIAILLGGYRLIEGWPRKEPIEITQPTAAETVISAKPTPVNMLVHVVGAVERPGVYVLPEGSRLCDAVEAAGGFAQNADPERMNLADYVHDAQQVYVPKIGSDVPPRPTPMDGRTTRGDTGSGLINLNTATSTELESLPGIGPALAERIIAYREAQGPFASPEEVMNVSGIGETRYEQMRGLITTQ